MIALWRKNRKKPPKPCAHQTQAVQGSPNHETAHSDSSRRRSPDDQGPAKTPEAGAPSVDAKGRCVSCRQDKRVARKYRWKVIGGLIFPFALQALDVTIIASALPWIATDFGQVSQFNWIISAFNLTSAAFIPFWGQIADIFGRHRAIQGAIVVMMIGSALCTGAPTNAFPVLLLGRGIQGVGCAGLNVVVRVILSDKVSLKENAKNWSIFSFTAGMSYGIGPVIGGALTNVNWRWCFAINLPICVLGIILIFFVLRDELLGPQPIPGLDERGESARRERLSRRIMTIDAGGQVLFLFGFGLIILALTWAGATYDWNTAAVLAPLCIGVLLASIFIYYESLMAPGNRLALLWPYQKAMIAWNVLTTKDTGLLFYINFATGAAMYSVLYFCNLYFTMVKGFGAALAGVQLLFYTPGLGIGVYLSMYFCNVIPRKTWVPLMLGSVIEAVGVGILSWALYSEHNATIFGMMALTGAGTGLRFMPGSLHAVGFFPNHIATVISVMAVALPFGGTLALTIMSTVFNNTSGIASSSPLRDVATLHKQDPAVLAQVVHSAKMGIVWAYVAITPLMILCVVAASLLGNVNITKDKSEGDRGYGNNVDHGIYLLRLLGMRHTEKSSLADAEKAPNGSVESATAAAANESTKDVYT